MNEQIKELWNKVNLQDEGNPPSIVITSERKMQKFAELIVKECTSFISDSLEAANVNLSSRPNDEYWLGFRHACDDHLTDIRQHFGVEK